jgi:hypothetical protein
LRAFDGRDDDDVRLRLFNVAGFVDDDEDDGDDIDNDDDDDDDDDNADDDDGDDDGIASLILLATLKAASLDSAASEKLHSGSSVLSSSE